MFSTFLSNFSTSICDSIPQKKNAWNKCPLQSFETNKNIKLNVAKTSAQAKLRPKPPWRWPFGLGSGAVPLAGCFPPGRAKASGMSWSPKIPCERMGCLRSHSCGKKIDAEKSKIQVVNGTTFHWYNKVTEFLRKRWLNLSIIKTFLDTPLTSWGRYRGTCGWVGKKRTFRCNHCLGTPGACNYVEAKQMPLFWGLQEFHFLLANWTTCVLLTFTLNTVSRWWVLPSWNISASQIKLIFSRLGVILKHLWNHI